MTTQPINFDSPAVQSYLTILQSVITRMATNSSNSKTWCVSLVSAIVVIVADKGKPSYVWISIVPIVLFFLLDAYYLSLERAFRDIYNKFIRKIHSSTATVDDVFLITPRFGLRTTSLSILMAGSSIAIWPFYGLLIIMLVIVRAWLI